MHGYHFKVWKTDLSRGRAVRVGLAPEVFARVIGGAGLGTWLLLQDCPPNVDPFAPECPLVFAWAPLAGAAPVALPGSDRFAVVTKSPLTGRLNDATCSSAFALAGKGTGADALVISGRCPEWSVLIVDEGGARAEPWPALLGLSAADAATQVRARLGERYHVAAIGPAGERGARYATLSTAGRHAGRGGTGAVLGAKRLKAVAVAGDALPPVADPAKLARLVDAWNAHAASPELARYRESGTLGTLADFERRGLLPARNFATLGRGSGGSSAHAFSVAAGMTRQRDAGSLGAETRFTDAQGRPARMEYENVFSLGALCGVEDPAVVAQAVACCDAYGLDTISTGATLAFAMDCAGRGLELPPPVAALGLRFGAGAALLAAIEAIGRGDSAGVLLGEGSRRLAERMGAEAQALAPHVKGLELPGYDPRALPSLALALAVGARGADHNKSSAYDADLAEGAPEPYSPASVRAVAEGEERAVLWDSLILSKFLRRALPPGAEGDAALAKLLAAVTGADCDADSLRECARHVLDLKKVFNQRQGWHAKEDTLPARFFAAEGGRAGLDRARFEQAVRDYYRLRGWDARGRSTGSGARDP